MEGHRDLKMAKNLDRREHVLRVIDQFESTGKKITVSGIARAAGVSRTLVRSTGITEYFQAAVERQRTETSNRERARTVGAETQLRHDKLVLQERNKDLRLENLRLLDSIRAYAAAATTSVGGSDLERRFDESLIELRSHKRRIEELSLELQSKDLHVRDLQEEVASLRASLSRIMRDGVREPPTITRLSFDD